MRMPGSPAPLICGGFAGPVTGQNAHEALNHALSQASKGAVLYTCSVSVFHFAQLRGQLTSLHSTALYTANPFSSWVPSCLYWLTIWPVEPPWRSAARAPASPGQSAVLYPPGRNRASNAAGPSTGPGGPASGGDAR